MDELDERAKTVIEYIKTLDAEKLDEAELDSAVHDTASTVASDVNNCGYVEQVKYLLDHGWTPETILGYMKAKY